MEKKTSNLGKNQRSKQEKKQGKKLRGKTVLLLLVSLVGIALLGWLAFILFGNNYKRNAMELKTNAIVATRLSNIMLDDYINNWVNVETNHSARNAEGVETSTEDAHQALAWRQQFFKANGTAAVLQQVVDELNDNASSMRLTPAKYRNTQTALKTLREQVGQLAALVNQPSDSLIDLVTAKTELNNQIARALEATDFNFWVSFDDVRQRTDALSAQLKDKNVVEALGKANSDTPNNAINELKYKKMGFKELPKGKGVLYHVLTEGKGAKPKDDTKVKLHYEGKLMDGTVFDSSYQRGEPVTMRPSQTVPGFWHSLTQMPVGSKWEIYIPNAQAYGNRAAGAVKPYSDLFFTIEVLGFEE